MNVDADSDSCCRRVCLHLHERNDSRRRGGAEIGKRAHADRHTGLKRNVDRLLRMLGRETVHDEQSTERMSSRSVVTATCRKMIEIRNELDEVDADRFACSTSGAAR